MTDTRTYWKDCTFRIVDPIFTPLSEGKLAATMPCRFYGTSDRTVFCSLEAFGRAFCGFAPFLDTEDKEVAAYRERLTRCLDHATAPDGPDYMNFGQKAGGQPLVDAAFLCEGLYRCRDFTRSLPDALKAQIVRALAVTRKITPPACNWILFSCLVELGIDLLGGECDLLRVLYGVRQFKQWYCGDGMYGDGADFHMDYYNSFVIQPMLIDTCRYFADRHPDIGGFLPEVLRRGGRYAQILERMIAHDGTYAYTGRSITYRFGTFTLLAQAVTEGFTSLSPAAVRCALTAVIRRVMDSGIFDDRGYLLHGIYGEQPSLAEDYICTGSLYLCCAVFLPLGLPAAHPFWQAPDEKWSSLRIVSGEDVLRDHAL